MYAVCIHRCSAFYRRANEIKQRTPLLNQLHLNFIFLHYTYIITWALIGSIVVYSGGGIAYTDALFLSVGAATQSGLNTVNLNGLHLYQQIVFYIITIICTPIFIHSALVFIRLYWFEKRFQRVARDARALRTTRSRMDNVSQDNDSEGINLAELGDGGRSIVVLRSNTGDARNGKPFDPGGKTTDDAQSETEAPEGHENSGQSSLKDLQNDRTEHRFGLGSLRVPAQLEQEQHIAFLEDQRKNKGALRIPSPREYDRGGAPEILDGEEDEVNKSVQPSSPQPDHRQSPMHSDEIDQVGPLEGPHIAINEPDMPQTDTRGSTFTHLITRSTVQDTTPMNEATGGLGPRGARNIARGIWRSLTQEKDHSTQPYLSWNATVARNSNFIDLTEEQRDELGGIEYRALKTLTVVLVSYYIGFHIIGMVSMVGWIMTQDRWGNVVREDGVGRPWWGIFTSASAFNDLGFTLTPDSMISFQKAVFPLLLMAFLIIIGNTGFPCMLRLVIWSLTKFARPGTALWEELKFLLDHPRRCFTLLFPRNATWWLFAILIALNGIDVIFFIILDVSLPANGLYPHSMLTTFLQLNNPTVISLPPGIRVLDGFFQAVSTRTAGFGVVNLSELHPSIQVSYLIMMYISVFPIAISMRRTNVYEEKNLGVYSYGQENSEKNDQTAPSYIGTHLRRQLGFDLWYVFLGLFVIAIVENGRLEAADDYSFQLFTVLFEVVSAYGTVGLSLGYPGVDTSFCGQFSVISKLVIIAVQIRGRHRGLPYTLDRAVLLPSDALRKHEAAESERQMRRRASNLSSGEPIGRPQSWPVSQARAGASLPGLYTGREN
ncbi:hypothetical protein VN97_g10600 [Penicillium thymicola]|uniref:Potassium transport protein n=1 Tax=Penicillium thymicola TaxID=293382 RepID=A0AAI9T8V2_PENTH|nr:hypothetical protein VN97_g10600 [Penicillium thymicola]